MTPTLRIAATGLACALALAGTAPSARAAESYDNCTGMIMSLPAVITTQGTWCMGQDLATAISSGAAIQISTHHVTLDCNGFKLGGFAAGDGTNTVGVYAPNRINISVRNCHVRGFRYGLQGEGSDFVVEDNRFEGNTQRGLTLVGERNTVRRNLVADTGGSTGGSGSAIALQLSGASDVIDNTIGGVYARVGSGQGAWGIHVAGAGADSIAEGNRVRAVLGDGAGAADSAAIRTVSTGRVTIRGNSLFANGAGIGIQCVNTGGVVKDNTMLGFATALSGCPSDGGNVAKP